MLEARNHWVDALTSWQNANAESVAQRFGDAEKAYERSQRSMVSYFARFYTSAPPPLKLDFKFIDGATIAEHLGTLVTVLFDAKDWLPALWTKVRRRREAITFEELQRPDWGGFSPAARPSIEPISMIRKAWTINKHGRSRSTISP